jgi:hypothetical protein
MDSNSACAAAAASAAALGPALSGFLLFGLFLSLSLLFWGIVFGDGQQDGGRPPKFLQSFFFMNSQLKS